MLRHGDVAGPEGHPLCRQPMGVVQVRERVELDGSAVPVGFDLAAQLGRQLERLAGVAGDDVVIRVVLERVHARDPIQA